MKVPEHPVESRSFWMWRPRNWVLFAVAIGLLAATAVGLYQAFSRNHSDPTAPDKAPRDPRLDYAGPFRNVHPDVGYVPDEQCAVCHADIARSYAQHPMGHSLLPTAKAFIPATDATTNNPFDFRGSRFRIDREGDKLWHRRSRLGEDGKPVAEFSLEVHYAIGSGTRGYSYLTERDGYLYETAISWYSQKSKWDLSPGFGQLHLNGRPIGADCLFCHANHSNPVPGTLNRYEKPVFTGHAIGCQRCHGPGELHVAGPGSDGLDPTIVNPKHLERSLREAVCEQCHLQGQARVLNRGREVYDFRPGLPLEQFLAVFVAAGDNGQGQKAVGQVEQMYQSQCFQKSNEPGALGCISCHDPHQAVPKKQRVTYYRDRCLTCHEQQGCKVPRPDRLKRSMEDSCIQCHMPRYDSSDIPHTAITDHRILRHGKPVPPKEAQPAPVDGLPVVSFFRGRAGVGDADDERSRAIALVQLAFAGKVDTATSLRHALPTLEGALQRHPTDLPAREASGLAYAARGRWTEALAAFESVLAREPERESSLLGAASAAEALNRPDAALGYWRRTVAANPWVAEYRRDLTRHLIKKDHWQEALTQSDGWIRCDPFGAEARVARVECLLAAGHPEEARAEFARVEALAPPNLHELRIRFERRLKKN